MSAVFAATAPLHLWVCTTCPHRKHAFLSCHRTWVNEPGREDFEACGFATADYDAAIAHVAETDHRMGEYLHGNWQRRERRSMHGSDMGGVYVNLIEGR